MKYPKDELDLIQIEADGGDPMTDTKKRDNIVGKSIMAIVESLDGNEVIVHLSNGMTLRTSTTTDIVGDAGVTYPISRWLTHRIDGRRIRP